MHVTGHNDERVYNTDTYDCKTIYKMYVKPIATTNTYYGAKYRTGHTISINISTTAAVRKKSTTNRLHNTQ